MSADPYARYTLTELPGRYAVCRLLPTAPIPAWADGRDDFCAITRTRDELSIICPQAVLPMTSTAEITAEIEAIEVARDWVVLRVEGPFAFDVTGVLAALSTVLAAAGVVLLAVATYQTDYLLVKDDQLQQAQRALAAAGHHVNVHASQ